MNAQHRPAEPAEQRQRNRESRRNAPVLLVVKQQQRHGQVSDHRIGRVSARKRIRLDFHETQMLFGAKPGRGAVVMKAP